MKKFLSLILILSLAFMFSACTDNEKSTSETQTPTKNEELTTDDIISLFKAAENDESIAIKDCVLTPDGAYDLVGVVMYINDENPCNLAFIDKDGVSQPVGVGAQIADDSVLTYAGNGSVDFKIINKDGYEENYTMIFSRDDDGVHFTAKSDIEI